MEGQERVLTPLPAAPAPGTAPDTAPAAATAWQPTEPKLLKFDPTKVDIAVGLNGQLLSTRTSDTTLNSSNQTFFQEQTQGTSPSLGLTASFHQQFRGWLGYDVNFGYTRTDLEHSVGTIETLSGTTSEYFEKSANRVNLYEFSVGYVVKAPTSSHRLQTFFEAGPGGLIYTSATPQPTNLVVRKRALLFGVGSDLRLSNHLGLRLEYRGLLTNTADSQLTTVATQTRYTVISEPTISLKYTFGAHKRMQ